VDTRLAPPKTIWNIEDDNVDLRRTISKALNISPITAQILINRGIDNIEMADRFINPSLEHFHDPFLIKDMDKAVKRILSAVDKGEKIYIYGDYDADGITATSLLILFFRDIGTEVSFYIPDRIKEGYGLHEAAIREIAQKGGQLIITVDCGISAVNEVLIAKDLGVDIVITDHHKIEDILPEAVAILHPAMEDSSYPFQTLAGVGVAFKLIKSLRSSMHRNGTEKEDLPNLKKYLDIVSIGTISDIVPLVDENHIIAKYGLIELSNTCRPGLKAIKDAARISDHNTTAHDIGYVIAPRINAAGRIGNASKAVTLLTTENIEEANILAAELEVENRKRQRMQQEIYKEAVKMIGDIDLNSQRAIVLASPNWHPGIIGIVASKIANQFLRPTVIFNLDGDTAKGSARSIYSFHLYNAISQCKDILLAFGGHEYAAGITIKTENMEKFRKVFNEIVAEELTKEAMVKHIDIDMEVSLSDIDNKLANELEMIAPFGSSNPSPLLCARRVRFAAPPTYMGKDRNHVRVHLEGGDNIIEAIAFNAVNTFKEIMSEDEEFDIAFTPEINRYMNSSRLQLNLKDIHSSNH